VKKTIAAGLLAGAIAGFAALPLTAATAADADPAATQVDGFDSALIGAMKAGRAVGVQGRYRALAPAVSVREEVAAATKFGHMTI